MTPLLTDQLLAHLPEGVHCPVLASPATPSIVHFGIGAFHRAHQAYALQRLIDLDPEKYSRWRICGVGILPLDIGIMLKLKRQHNLYSLKSMDADGNTEVRVINALAELLYGPEESDQVISKIAQPETKVISFTITEGGYNIDEATGSFNLKDPDIQADLSGRKVPFTVFGYLAKGLQKRRENNAGKITLLSCDNIVHNGDVLRQALRAFITAYDSTLLTYIEEMVYFPNSMVDRITPVSSPAIREEFTAAYGYRDECLVVSEQYFQWVIESNPEVDFPPLQQVGVDFVDDVAPYEQMKLSILNGGHTLIGLIGDALQFSYIHEGIRDPVLSEVFDLYMQHEVIPALAPLNGVDYTSYSGLVKKRFSNDLIRDHVERIISNSSAKIPRFILPIVQQRRSDNGSVEIAALIIAAWWFYLQSRIRSGRIQEIEDPKVSIWAPWFDEDDETSLSLFLQNRDLFGALSEDNFFYSRVKNYSIIIKNNSMKIACEKVIQFYA